MRWRIIFSHAASRRGDAPAHSASHWRRGRGHERFQSERAKEYLEFGERCQEFLHEIEKETLAQKFTFAELEENEQDLLKLTRWLRKIQQRDFFPETSHHAANEAMTRCREAMRQQQA